jgi:hypothetical protein
MATTELALTLFTFVYIVAETTMFINDHMRRGTRKVIEENQVRI